jgi:mono/diheme cytochrome c family protein
MRILAVLSVLCFGSLATAGNCYQRVVAFRSYYAPAVTYSYAAPVYVQQDYVKVQPVAVSPDYYFSLSKDYQTDVLADAVVGRLVRLGLVAVQPGGVGGGARTEQGAVPSGSAPAPPPASSLPPPRKVDDAEAWRKTPIAGLLAAHCVKCHGPTRAEMGLRLDGNPEAVPLEKRACAFGRVTLGPEFKTGMPKDGAQLDDKAIAVFADWVGKK